MDVEARRWAQDQAAPGKMADPFGILEEVTRGSTRLLPILAGALTAMACGEDERPGAPRPAPEPDASALRDSSDPSGPPLPDAPGLCGNQVIRQKLDPPNLYFVLDRSLSMGEPLVGSGYSKFTAARLAIAEVVRAIGHRVRYGAAVFPSSDSHTFECAPGEEVFACQNGDPVEYALRSEDGPLLLQLVARLTARSPEGGTPTSPTLRALSDTLTGLPGETVVVLATDGEPNCNPDASCSGIECTLNAAGASTDDGRLCGADVNCCDPGVAEDGPLFCADAEATILEIGKLREAGVRTFVIGLPGSEDYAAALDDMAEAGGTARSASPQYYPVAESSDLSDTLMLIGVSVAISCEVDLETEPPDPELVNVYFDARVVAFDEDEGWTLTTPQHIVISGEACEELESGRVFQVQVVAGCPRTPLI